jgi:hypothetical protein
MGCASSVEVKDTMPSASPAPRAGGGIGGANPLAATGSHGKPPVAVLDELGGPVVVRAVSERVFARFRADPELARFFEGVDGERLTERQVQ